jgi:hypothetical protein
MKDPSRRHARLDAIAPWRRREHARKTGDKCERRQFNGGKKSATVDDRDKLERKQYEKDLRTDI